MSFLGRSGTDEKALVRGMLKPGYKIRPAVLPSDLQEIGVSSSIIRHRRTCSRASSKPWLRFGKKRNDSPRDVTRGTRTH